VAPNTGLVNLVAAWFGDDLRCGECTIRPKVENSTKETRKGGSNFPWTVAGLTRSTAQVMTQIDGRPAFGGAPNDASLIAGIQELKARGFRVMLYPFIMMDIASDNALPNPYSDNAGETGQSAYPWRGRITISPAAGFDGSPDKTAVPATRWRTSSDPPRPPTSPRPAAPPSPIAGPAEWSYRRFILHMAKICELAGGVDLFCIGSELVGLTRARDGATSYPFVAGLIDLAGEVRTMLPGARIGYAADWSEYHSHRPGDGTGDVLFNLDPLWADANIDFIGIDNYLPLADWRDGTEHLDYSSTGPTTTYDLDYLKGNIEGGEYYDWFYPAAGVTGNEPSPERLAQTRTDIVDGSAAAEHWVFRQKDIRNWWRTPTMTGPAEPDRDRRPPGCRNPSPSSSPNSAVRPSTRAPTSPTCSSIRRVRNPSCLTSRRVRATTACHGPFSRRTSPIGKDEANNPESGVYAGRMIETASTCIWSWDARMVPSFPDDEGPGPMRQLGTRPLDLGAARRCLRDPRPSPPSWMATALPIMPSSPSAQWSMRVVDRILSARDVIDAIAPAYFAYAVEARARSGSARGSAPRSSARSTSTDLVEVREAERFSKRRSQESELPAVVKLSYGEPTSDDLAGAVEARRLAGTVASSRTLDISLPVVMPESRARAVAETLLHDAWAAREGLEFALPPSELALDAGDVLRLTAGVTDTFRLTEIADGGAAVPPGARGCKPLCRPGRTAPRSRSRLDSVIGQPESCSSTARCCATATTTGRATSRHI
jgi:hypothetical protein